MAKERTPAMGQGLVRGTLFELGRIVRRPAVRRAYAAWLDVLPQTALLAETVVHLARRRSIAHHVQQHAQKKANKDAVRDEHHRWSWDALELRGARAAKHLRDAGLGPGDTLALRAYTSAPMLAAIVGAARVGVRVSLIHPETSTDAFAHALREAPAKLVWTGPGLANACTLPSFESGEADRHPLHRPAPESDFLILFTSGTTGMPKACPISHARAQAAGAGAASIGYGFAPGDLLYSVLPLHHAAGLLLGACACLISGTPIVLRKRFSASRFFEDVNALGATAFNYIGEIGRYLSRSVPARPPRSLRVALGNGLRSDAWRVFEEELAVTNVREFYGATESPGALLNVSGRRGSIGHLPLPQLGYMRIVRANESGPIRVRGRFIDCAFDEVGELLIRLPSERFGHAQRLVFRGYTDERATEKKVLRNAFRAGDRYFRTGDAVRMDEDGFVYFVDRLGDTFRWKGENVSTEEVERVADKVVNARTAVVGVHVPQHEGRAGLLAVEGTYTDGVLEALADAPFSPFARPSFVRFVRTFEETSTYKVVRAGLRKDGADPATVSDPLFVWDGSQYVRLDRARWREICDGTRRI